MVLKVEESKETKNPPENSNTLDNTLQCFVIGISKENKPIFEIFGEQKNNIIGLLGLLSLANKKINQILDTSIGSGDALIGGLHNGIQIINQKLDMINLNTTPKTKE